jgi:hypothetical protein
MRCFRSLLSTIPPNKYIQAFLPRTWESNSQLKPARVRPFTKIEQRTSAGCLAEEFGYISVNETEICSWTG